MSKQYPGGFITKNFTAPTASAAPGMWTLDQAMYYIKQSLWPLPPQPDPYFEYVTALLHGNGNAAGTTLFNQDASTNNLPLTINNDLSANVKTPFTPPAGTSTYGSGYFPGSNGYLYTPSTTEFGFGTGDFTMEAWVWLGAQVNTYPNWIQLGTANNNASLPLGAGWGDAGVGYVLMIKVGTDRLISGYNQSSFVGVWSHIAVVRSSGVVKTYINGTVVDTWASTADVGSTNFLRSGCGINEYGNFPWNGYISNLRVTNTAVYTNNFTPSTSPLTAVAGTKLLTMQTNFTGNNNLFYDSSSNNFAITRNGNTTQGTFTPYGANWSNYFDGSGDYLTVPNSTAFDLSTSDFTIEGFFYPTVGSAFQSVFAYASNAGASISDYAFQLLLNSSNGINFRVVASGGSSFTTISTSNTFTLNSWNYVCVTRTGTSVSVYLNGTTTTGTIASTIRNNASSILTLGRDPDGTFAITGYLSNLRILKGTAVTPSTPTTPLTAVTNTSLLTCQSNRFIDNSTNNFTITRNGNTSVQRFSPFSPSAAYTASTIGGSGYFDGNGDFLTMTGSSATNFAGVDWTVETWVYSNGAPPADYTYIIQSQTGTNNWLPYFGIALMVNGTINCALNAANYTSTQTINFNTWNHLAMVRSGGVVKLYINGVASSVSATVDITNSNLSFWFGKVDNSPGGGSYIYYLNGYMSNTRFVKGTAVYTSNFTVPTAPLTAITNTSLLLSNTNAGILDNAMMTDWETVGDATVSPTTYKYGGGSMKFDGTADRLTSAANPGFSFGTGDFTIEAWINTNVLTGERGFFQTSATAGGLQTSYTNGVISVIVAGAGSYTMTANVGGTNVTGSTAITTGTWYHVAITRASGSVRLFINGALSGGPTTITADLNGQNLCVGGYYNTSYLWNGYIDDFRITKGYARYTAAFTPPTSQLPDL